MFKRIAEKYRLGNTKLWGALFIFFFSYMIIYYTASHLQSLALNWDLFDTFLSPDQQSTDLTKIIDILYMASRGHLIRAFMSAWSLAPFWVTMACAMSIAYLYLMLEKVKHLDKTHPLEYIINIVFGLLIITAAYIWYPLLMT